MKKITLILTGSVATIKYNKLIDTLSTKYLVNVIYTDNAKMFLNQYGLNTKTNVNKIFGDSFTTNDIKNIDHIQLNKETDLILIAPATFNYINKLANGFADSFSLSFLAACDPKNILIAPAMNTHMYENKILQQNIEKLKSLDIEFIDPIKGLLACNDVGIGKLESIDNILKQVDIKLNNIPTKKAIVTAGSTKLFLDPVRYITNKSSGKFALAICQELLKQNYEVTLLHSEDIDTSSLPQNINLSSFITNEDLDNLIELNKSTNDVIIMVAAPVDYVTNPSKHKIKNSLSLNLDKGKDIIKNVDGILKFGFCLETENHLYNGEKKLIDKNLDWILINDGKTMGSDDVYNPIILTKNEVKNFDKLSKKDLAKEIVEVLNGSLN